MLQRLLIIFILLLPLSAHAKDVSLSMIYTNAMDKELPFAIFTKGNWQPNPQARFVKVHMYFDEPFMVQGLEIDTCGEAIKPNISVFFNFDQWALRLDPDLAGEIPEAMRPQSGKNPNNNLIFDNFMQPIEVRSLTFNFESNTNFKICGLNLKDPKGEVYRIKAPKVIQGSVSATSVLNPIQAYEPINLFDSRFEYGWASDKKATNVGLTFNFDKSKRIEKIRIWNGYQRSITHCYSNSRARKIHVTGDGGYAADIEIQDVLGSQVVDFPKAFEGKQLKFEVTNAFMGKSYKDLVISELRFFDGTDWFLIDPSQKLQTNIQKNHELFEIARADALLNESYLGSNIEEYVKEMEKVYGDIVLRLRADGSFYLAGATDPSESELYFTLGNYEVKDAGKNGIKLRLFGLYYETEMYGDCNGCGRDCNKHDLPEGVARQKIFQESVTIKPMGDGSFEIVNLSGGKKLPFSRIVLNKE